VLIGVRGYVRGIRDSRIKTKNNKKKKKKETTKKKKTQKNTKRGRGESHHFGDGVNK